jgi:hypothetical protein
VQRSNASGSNLHSPALTICPLCLFCFLLCFLIFLNTGPVPLFESLLRLCQGVCARSRALPNVCVCNEGASGDARPSSGAGRSGMGLSGARP